MSFGRLKHLSFSIPSEDVINNGHAMCVHNFLNPDGITENDIPLSALIAYQPSQDEGFIDFKIFWKPNESPFNAEEMAEFSKYRIQTEPFHQFIRKAAS